jgi:hypothetical protein
MSNSLRFKNSRKTWDFPINMPELVLTSLSILFPDSLSATIDFSSLSLAYSSTKSVTPTYYIIL